MLQVVIRYVPLGDFQRPRGNVSRIYGGVGERVCKQYGKATRTGAQIQCEADCTGVFYPRRKLFPQQLGNEGAWYDHALIDEKAEISQPRLAGEVCRRNF